ncbi:hypothetical protein HYQ45_006973 [Verticillium longisporum]|uniref:Uncharacterized protein n=1 Tax=Verticillium longisporum TaxID=100787 RepID=A0A8I2ZN52_VERLO|nr:hypothetical protein HYQ45_006973 [Verticillium longisporum]
MTCDSTFLTATEPVNVTHRPKPVGRTCIVARQRQIWLLRSFLDAGNPCAFNSLAIPSQRSSAPHSGWHAVAIATARQVPPTLDSDSRHATTTTHPYDTHIMPPHLHPRSRMTSSLFATTVVASFFVVGLPHILPCPAPRVAYADGEVVVGEDGKRRRRRRRDNPPEIKDGIVHFDQTPDTAAVSCSKDDRASRECPMPRPGGMLGEWLGFHAEKKVDQRTN